MNMKKDLKKKWFISKVLKVRTTLLKNWLVFLVLLFISCSDDSIRAVPSNKTFSVSAGILNQENQLVCDTVIAVRDTLLLVGVLKPDTNIVLQTYYWESEQGIAVPEFRHRKTFSRAGKYVLPFIAVDTYGDTLSDSVWIHVSTPPVLDTVSFVPQHNSCRLPSDSIPFAWNAEDADGDKMYFRFKLFCENTNKLLKQDSIFSDTLIDTILFAPSFLLNQTLPELETCYWNVSVIDEFGIAGNLIQGTFFTQSVKNQGRIKGQIVTVPDTVYREAKVILEAKENSQKSDTLTLVGNAFKSDFLNPGDYKIYAMVPQWKDYVSDTLQVHVRADELKTNLLLVLKDSTPVQLVKNFGDTLFIDSDSSFVCEIPLINGGVPLNADLVTAALDGVLLSTKVVQKNGTEILQIPIPAYALPIPRFLYLKIKDMAGNQLVREITILKKNLWAETLRDTTLSESETLKVFYVEKNPYSLTLKKVTWLFEKNETLPLGYSTTQIPDSSGRIEFTIPANTFGKGEHFGNVTAQYSNGLEIVYSIKIVVGIK